MSILELHNVKKSFGDKEIIKELDFSVPEGSIFGFVGENGAGKTTTMRMILGLETIDSGYIKVNDKRVHYGNSLANRVIGYLPDVPEYYDYMNPSEYLTLCGNLTGVPKKELSNRITQLLKTVDLPINKKRISGFSRGMKQRLGIAQALLNRPKLLICDEPTSALDPIGRSEFLDLLASLRGEMTIIFSTHILSDVERISDRVGILDDGILKVNDTLDNLKSDYAKPQIVLDFDSENAAKKANALLNQQAYQDNSQLIIDYRDSYQESAKFILERLLKAGLIPISLNRQLTSLEDIFMEVTR
ncbi:ABC transporter ATP-binding protein [Companilactobacillus farciminis]|uniref:ABC transporter ATP-binding protein n=1 Tax=Companilactobacillus farciminis TaxID=1612 RepID=UPI00232E9E05|nr:ABC transporter ATP-binding protein [Companilactobacillus farciminis]WCG35228.1 ABC transporter ATP-binding protein [Companilactobacillus farciminis]